MQGAFIEVTSSQGSSLPFSTSLVGVYMEARFTLINTPCVPHCFFPHTIPPHTMPSLAAVPFLLGSLVALQWLWSWRSAKNLPPGPRALPIIGNVHQLPMEHQEKAFVEWGKKFGE